MPRCARRKSCDSIYHIMVRSISDTLLYREDNDKDKYLYLVKKYQDTFGFKVYAYCIMDTHAHMIIDAAGADISSIMHGINQSYAQYFNLKYNRHGHLFQDRFKSKIIDSERYLFTLSGYIHNNPSDMDKYKNNVESYKYSSLGIYIGVRSNSLSLVDYSFIIRQFGIGTSKTKKAYLSFVYKCDSSKLKNDMEFKDEKTEYRSERKIIIRDYSPDKVAGFVASYTNQDKTSVKIKYVKRVREMKALSALLMRSLCDMKEKDICSYMGNITQSHVSKLCAAGLEIMDKRPEYKNIIKDFIERQTC